MTVYYNFKWNPEKARLNIRKHRVSFEQAATVFLDPLALSLLDEEHSEDEERWITMGRSREAQTLVVVHTYREGSDNNATIRIISARKATKHEQQQYESNL